MRFMIGFAMAAILAASAHAEGPGKVTNLAPFKAVELRGDGVVKIRHGAVQAVELVAGDRWVDSFTVDAQGKLVVKGCKGCGAGFRVTVVTPEVEALGVVGEGVVVVGEGFPRRSNLTLNVSQGGRIDAVALEAEAVAAVATGPGRIDAAAAKELVAEASGTGEITYTGAPRLITNTSAGGSVRPAK